MQIQFNAYDYDPSQGSAICFPLADYKIEITGAEPKVVKDNPSAGYLELALTIGEGDCRGMVQKDRLNIFHTSEIAKQIAHRQLAAYCFAIGRPFVQNTEDLIGGRCICTIGPQEGSDKYSEVKVVKCMDGTLPTRQTPAGQAQAAPQQAPPPPQPSQAIPQQTAAAPAPNWNQAPQSAPAPTAAPANAPPWTNAGVTTGVPPWAK